MAGHLSLKGYVPSLTFKNYPEVDLFYLNLENGKHGAIQVKTVRDGERYFVPEKIDQLGNPFVFVRINADESVEFYIAPAKEVAKLSSKAEKDYRRTHPNSAGKKLPKMVSIKRLTSFKDRWEHLALE